MTTKEEVLKMLKHPSCDICGACNAGVVFITNPFDEEVHGEINKQWLCTECYEDLCDDI